LIFDNKSLPVTAIKHQIPNDTNPTELIGVSVIFKNEMQTSAYGALSGLNPIFPTKQSIANPIGAFKKNDTENFFTVAYRDGSGQTKYTEYNFSYTETTDDIIINTHQQVLSVYDFDKNIRSIAPRFNASNWESANAVTVYTDNTLTGVTFVYATNSLASAVMFSLAPVKNTATVNIDSGKCIDDFDMRTETIKKQLWDNLNAPQGNPIGTFYRTNKVKEVL